MIKLDECLLEDFPRLQKNIFHSKSKRNVAIDAQQETFPYQNDNEMAIVELQVSYCGNEYPLFTLEV
jgi:hypothetical protein